jgi:hypothetical protein
MTYKKAFTWMLACAASFRRKARVRVAAAEDGAAHASLDAMVGAGNSWMGDMGAGTGHADSIAQAVGEGCRKRSCQHVGKF